MRVKQRELVVVGGGPAGMAAALSAAESGARDILLLERDQFLGGVLNQCVHTGFGLEYFKEALTGPEYAERFLCRLESQRGVEVSRKSLAVELTKDKVLTYLAPGRIERVKAGALVMATGARERTREMVHIPGTRPAGIMTAGFAQKLINIEGLLPGKEAVIVGSGDIGLIMARRFALEGARVKAVIEIQQKPRGLARNVALCLRDFDIPLYLGHKVARIFGKDRVEGVDVAAVDEKMGEISTSRFSIKCDTILISVGLIPENELIEMAGAALDETMNTPVAAGLNQTSIPGLFVCGNAFKIYDIVDTVTRDAERAGRAAAEYLRR